MIVAREVTVGAAITLAELLELWALDDDGGIRFVREVNGRRQLTTIKPLPPDYATTYSVRQEVMGAVGYLSPSPERAADDAADPNWARREAVEPEGGTP